ncbi:ABC transporter substrate-binding protein [Rhodococcus hoagii]|nr:ABC transporter substrate-binding protein [Prescottella equi]
MGIEATNGAATRPDTCRGSTTRNRPRRAIARAVHRRQRDRHRGRRKARPDLILAPWSGVTQQQYDALSALAPTVAYAEKAWTTTWEDQIRVIGKAMGKAPEADQEIAKIKAQFADATAAHPSTRTCRSRSSTTPARTLGVFFPDEQRVAMVRGLGLQVDPIVNTLPETEGTDSALIGLENAHLLKDSDLLFTFYSDDATARRSRLSPSTVRSPQSHAARWWRPRISRSSPGPR